MIRKDLPVNFRGSMCAVLTLASTMLTIAGCSSPDGSTPQADGGIDGGEPVEVCQALGAKPFEGVIANPNQYTSLDIARGGLNEAAMQYTRYEFYNSVINPAIQLIREFPKLRVWRDKQWKDIDLNTTVYSGNGGTNLLFINGKLHFFYTSGNSSDPTTFNNYVLIEGDVPGKFSAPFKIGPTYMSQSGEHSVALNAQDGRIGMVVSGKETAAEAAIHLFYVEKKAGSSIWTSEAIKLSATSADMEGAPVYFTYGKDNTAWAVVQSFASTGSRGLHVLHRVGGSWDDVQVEADTATNRVNAASAKKIMNGTTETLAVTWNNFVGSDSSKLVVSVMGAMIDMSKDKLVVPPAQVLLGAANSTSLLLYTSILSPSDGKDGYIFADEISDQRAWIGRISGGVFSALTPYLKDEKVTNAPTGFYAPCGEAQVVLATGNEADRGDLAKTVRIDTL